MLFLSILLHTIASQTINNLFTYLPKFNDLLCGPFPLSNFVLGRGDDQRIIESSTSFFRSLQRRQFDLFILSSAILNSARQILLPPPKESRDVMIMPNKSLTIIPDRQVAIVHNGFEKYRTKNKQQQVKSSSVKKRRKSHINWLKHLSRCPIHKPRNYIQLPNLLNKQVCLWSRHIAIKNDIKETSNPFNNFLNKETYVKREKSLPKIQSIPNDPLFRKIKNIINEISISRLEESRKNTINKINVSIDPIFRKIKNIINEISISRLEESRKITKIEESRKIENTINKINVSNDFIYKMNRIMNRRQSLIFLKIYTDRTVNSTQFICPVENDNYMTIWSFLKYIGNIILNLIRPVKYSYEKSNKTPLLGQTYSIIIRPSRCLIPFSNYSLFNQENIGEKQHKKGLISKRSHLKSTSLSDYFIFLILSMICMSFISIVYIYRSVIVSKYRYYLQKGQKSPYLSQNQMFYINPTLSAEALKNLSKKKGKDSSIITDYVEIESDYIETVDSPDVLSEVDYVLL